MDPPPPPFPSSSSSSSSNASATMVIITVVGILAAFALLASYYAFVTKCQPLRALWSRNPPWNRRARGGGGGRQVQEASSVIRAAVAGSEHRGLGLPLIRMLPVVKFTADAPRISVSECAVCLSEFEERERVRLLPNCSHAFHIDCIDTWLQGSARCPFCRRDVTLPAALPLPPQATSKTATTAHSHRRADDELLLSREDDSIVIEVRGERETWFGGGHEQASTTPAGRSRHHRRQKRKAESVGDEAIDTRNKDEAFAVQPLRRSLSLDSSCDKHLYLSTIQEYLATQRQVSSVI